MAQIGSGLINRNNLSLDYLTVSIGPEYCFSDIQGSFDKQISLKDHDISFGFRKTFSNDFGYKVAFNYSNFAGKDSNDDNDASIVRNYSYTSSVMQLAIQGEYSLKIGSGNYNHPAANSIYVFLGAGVLRSDAKLNLNSQLPRDNYIYKPVYYAPVIPLGIGYQYDFDNGFLMGAEFNFRYPFSDYIDGFKPPTVVLQNGKTTVSRSNDVMGGLSITFSYLIGTEYLNRH